MANWIIDRTINLDEFKTREVLKQLLIVPRLSDETMENVLHQKGVLKNAGDGALRRRWYTYLRNYGLLKEDDVTEIGKYYAESKLSLSELSLLQLIKKKIAFSIDNNMFFPLKIICLLLSNLKNISSKETYFTREEFVNYICNVGDDSNSAVEELTNTIINSRNNNTNLEWIEGQHDDIWFNSLSQTGLFDYFGRSLYVKDWNMLDLICNFYNSNIGTIVYGNFNFEFINSIPFPVKNDSIFDLNKAKEIKNYSHILFDFFFKYDDIRKLEETYFSNKKKYKGVLELANYLNINASNIGLYRKFVNYPNIIITKFENSEDSELKEIAKLMQETTIKNDEETPSVNYDNCERLTGGENIILYGVPGAGKSWTVKNYYCDESTKMERVVFHPDFTYSDFVGQIMPKSENGDVTYKFIPGPFTKIVRDSYKNPMQKYILVIEEINRGNAPAIFGDIFQLLDRNKDGASEYKITNADIAKEVFGVEDKEVFLPSNLSIICTMNTSDQNVFTLDTAFQRRWNMRLIENVFKKETKEDKDFAEQKILDTSIAWEDFCNAINTQILDKNQNMTSSEDKRLGTHFVNLEDLIFVDVSTIEDEKERKVYELKNRRFPEKVIKYLWDDAFKFYRDEIFKENLNSLEKVIKEFTTAEKDARFDIFKDVIKAALFEESKKSKSAN